MEQNLIERIARRADIDTRLALGVPPGRLPKTDFNPLRMMPTTFRYFPALKKLVYINFDESYDVYCWEVFEDIEPLGDEMWVQGPNGRNRGVWRGLDDFMYFDKPGSTFEFYFAGRPEIVS